MQAGSRWWLRVGIALAVAGGLTVVCMSEIGARAQFAEQIAKLRSEVQGEIVQRAQQGAGSGVGDAPDRLQTIIGVQAELSALQATGAFRDDQTLRGLRTWMSDLLLNHSKGAKKAAADGAMDSLVSLASYVSILRYWQNDYLLALAMVAAAILGATLALFGRDGAVMFSSLVLAGGAGIMSFLLVKGGKQVFLMQLDSAPVAINPYTSVVVGLLAGMFREQAWALLVGAVVQASAKLGATLKREP